MAENIKNHMQYQADLYTYMKRFFSTEYKLKTNERVDLKNIITNSLNQNIDYESIAQCLISYLKNNLKNSSKVASVYMQRAITLGYIRGYLINQCKSNSSFKFIVDKLEIKSIFIIDSYIPIILESLGQSVKTKGGSNYEDHI